MLRPVLVLVVAAAIAGCTSGGEPAKAPAGPGTTPPEPTGSQGGGPPLPGLTDTLYLLVAPHASGKPPTSAGSWSADVPASSDPLAAPLEWRLPPVRLATYTVTGSVWVEVQGPVYATSPDCFWAPSLAALDGQGNGVVAFGCIAEPLAVGPGVRRLDFSILLTADDLEPTRLTFGLSAASVIPPGSSVQVLASSAEHPSRVTVAGLQVPLDTTTYAW